MMRRGGKRGVLLLETLLSMAVLAIGLFAAYDAVGAAGRSLQRTGAGQAALDCARRVLPDLLTGAALSGVCGEDLRWRIDAEPEPGSPTRARLVVESRAGTHVYETMRADAERFYTR